MVSKSLLSPILEDENLTRGLGDPEARVLVEWLVDRTEASHAASGCEERSRRDQSRWHRRGRSIARFVELWCYHQDHGAACQLAATERFGWPFPATDVDPCDLMVQILEWELEGTAEE